MKKRFVLIIVILLLFSCVYQNYGTIRNIFLHNGIDTNSSEKLLSAQEFKNLEDKLSEVAEKQNPRVALAQLAQESKESNAVAGSCHLLAHDIGHAAFKKYKSFGEAMMYQNEVCNSGYMHGVIESYFSSAKDISSSMLTVCDGYRPGSFISWECYHGIGHGFMFFNNNNVPLSLSDCNFTQDGFSWSSCVNGVFMENFNTDPDQKIHTSQYLIANDPFYPCDKEAVMYKANCYLYPPAYYLELHKGAYKDALMWCLTAESGYQGMCTEGAGIEFMKENINNPKQVEQLCMEGKGDQKNQCIFGMVDLYINNFGSLTPARSLCNQLSSENKPTCEKVIALENSMFE